MKIITNEKLIQRNRKIGQAATVSSLAVLGVGLYISFARPEQIVLAYVALLVGFTLSQIGIYFGNHWGRSPRPDEMIDQALKGLDDRYSVYHYSSPVPHLLVGPVGVWALLPYRQKGTFTYEKNRYRQKGGSFYMKVFAQEGLGRPDLEVENQKKALERTFTSEIPDPAAVPPVNALLVFTNDHAEIELDDAPTPGIPVKKLKEFVRKKANKNALSLEQVNLIRDALPKEA